MASLSRTNLWHKRYEWLFEVKIPRRPFCCFGRALSRGFAGCVSVRYRETTFWPCLGARAVRVCLCGGATIPLGSFRGVVGGVGVARGSGREDGGLSFPFVPVFRSFLPIFVGGLVSDEGVFDSGEVAPVLSVSKSVRFLLLFPPPRNVSVSRSKFCPAGGGESDEVSHPCRPFTNPSRIQGFVFDVFQCLCDESVVCAVSVFGIKVPQVLREGDDGAHHLPLEAPEVA